MSQKKKTASSTSAPTAGALLRGLGVAVNAGRAATFRIWIEESDLTIQLNLDSKARPGWACFVTRKHALSFIEKGAFGSNDLDLPILEDIRAFPAWAEAVGTRLGTKLDLSKARIELGRLKSAEGPLREWLSPGKVELTPKRPSLRVGPAPARGAADQRRDEGGGFVAPARARRRRQRSVRG
jgi:hypothetical protein